MSLITARSNRPTAALPAVRCSWSIRCTVGEARRHGGHPRRLIRGLWLLGVLVLGDGRVYATSRSFWASARDCSFFSDWFSIWRIRSRVTLNVRPTSSSVRGCSPPRP